MDIVPNIRSKRETFTYESVCWKSLLQNRKGTSKILVDKSVVRGMKLEPGTPIYSYIAHDSDGRPVLISSLDGEPRIPKKAGEKK